ncbi:hypothetical protein ACQKK5_12870 [Brevibacillus panacihumi]|uniref:hypothetical protein n=1 Tax=Brevibacillus panacihumi TaxID=497735 RepID=UPI003D0576B1
MRDVPNRYQGLPPRSAEMLHQIVRKFYRGAVSHFDVIQEKKAEVRAAAKLFQESQDEAPLRQTIKTLFLEFHFYTTCWLQMELALYRLARKDERLARVHEAFQPEWKKHLDVRERLEETDACVNEQFQQEESAWMIAEQDAYRFGEIAFTVDEQRLQALHDFYQAIETVRKSG